MEIASTQTCPKGILLYDLEFLVWTRTHVLSLSNFENSRKWEDKKIEGGRGEWEEAEERKKKLWHQEASSAGGFGVSPPKLLIPVWQCHNDDQGKIKQCHND
ncbi:hypothetical protein CKAN_00193000 [Cinnamomum micranthum f. kanehirae]|uniref:Uncharacterized protein n=1 Tax=Cinnamomum micranthum f. kanehirae TaxID=337451 RepID=A0A3S4N7F5_9MAGN|nr:hypothetical protein CKAN_00193000 [Cinnamomum micranthum f. kanehirae]